MILRGLKDLHKFLDNLNPAYNVDLHTCLTVQVENLHAMSHFSKDQLQTTLQYARNLANTVYESIKRVVPWAADYFTHDSSYYPVVEQATPPHAIPRMSHLKPTRQLNATQKDQMREWASDNGRVVRQRSVRQETTKFKAGTLPLNMYRSSYTPAEKVVFPAQPSPDDVETTASDIQPHDQQYDGSSDVSGDSEQVQEYDTDSDVSEQLSDDEDVLTFLRGIRTSSGRMVRVVRPLM